MARLGTAVFAGTCIAVCTGCTGTISSAAGDGATPPDAAGRSDSGPLGTPDASPYADASTPPDASIPPDAGRAPDAGGVDSGMVPPDAGSVDSGLLTTTDGNYSFPATSIIYQDVSGAALDPNSTAIINHLADGGGWGTPVTHAFQLDFGLTVLYADNTVALRAFTPATGYYSPDCDMTLVPIPPGGNAEGQPDYTCDVANNDCHVLVYQGQRLYELYQATINGGTATGSPFTTICEVIWDLTYDYWAPGANPYSRGDQCTSADAAGMPIAPLLVTGAELQAGVVSHAMRFTLPNPEIQASYYLHPGTHAGGPSGDPLMPTYAARFRLKSSFNTAGLSAGALVIAQALQKYGMFLDDGGNIPLTIDQSAAAYVGSHDLASLQVTDFEIVASPDPEVFLTDICQRTPVTDPNNMP
jgi:hypothetical protein